MTDHLEEARNSLANHDAGAQGALERGTIHALIAIAERLDKLTKEQHR